MTSIKNTTARLNDIHSWLEQVLANTAFKVDVASSDASFRRYFRITTENETLILMDAPPSQEDTKRFIDIATFMGNNGVHVPKIIAHNVKAGFLLLTDFGSRAYLDELNEQTADKLYKSAIDSIISMQLLPTETINLPAYDANLLHRELSLFPEWFLNKHLSINTPSFLESTFELLINNSLEQPQAFVHRDYHSRNLMHTTDNSPGIIDFQDAVIGAISYDLMSLLRDCYIEWPDDKIALWIEYYYEQALRHNILSEDVSLAKFTQWCDWMGLQRHIKVLGIFTRLHYRDGKSNYMDDLALTLHYVRKIAAKYPEFSELSHFLQQYDTIVAI